MLQELTIPSIVTKHRTNFHFLLCAVWSLILVVGSVLPSKAALECVSFSGFTFPLLHMSGYGLLAFMVCRYLDVLKPDFQFGAFWIAALSLLYAVSWGAMNEALQGFCSTRTPEVEDLVCNFVGAGTGVILFFVVHAILSVSLFQYMRFRKAVS